MKKNILHAIFFDEYNHWDNIVRKYDQRIRTVVQSEVNKFRHCGEIIRGFRLFVCEGCNDVKKVAFRCKGGRIRYTQVNETAKADFKAKYGEHIINRQHVSQLPATKQEIQNIWQKQDKLFDDKVPKKYPLHIYRVE